MVFQREVVKDSQVFAFDCAPTLVRIFLLQENFSLNKTNRRNPNIIQSAKKKKERIFLAFVVGPKNIAFVLTQKYPHTFFDKFFFGFHSLFLESVVILQFQDNFWWPRMTCFPLWVKEKCEDIPATKKKEPNKRWKKNWGFQQAQITFRFISPVFSLLQLICSFFFWTRLPSTTTPHSRFLCWPDPKKKKTRNLLKEIWFFKIKKGYCCLEKLHDKQTNLLVLISGLQFWFYSEQFKLGCQVHKKKSLTKQKGVLFLLPKVFSCFVCTVCCSSILDNNCSKNKLFTCEIQQSQVLIPKKTHSHLLFIFLSCIVHEHWVTLFDQNHIVKQKMITWQPVHFFPLQNKLWFGSNLFHLNSDEW